MSDDKPLPFARGALPDRDRFTIADALDLIAEAVCPGAWEDGNLAAQVSFIVARDEVHRPALQRAVDAAHVEVFDPLGRRGRRPRRSSAMR